MALAPGSRLGVYEVLAPLGQGGMGEVYRARDRKLQRDVALKILPDAFAHDPERLARFQREAQVLASLNHPNIGGIYGLEDSSDTKALVLELVEGPTLADRIAQGAIPVDEALPVAKQIAEALEAAHEAGVIHRDLKPGNIKLRPDGTVKVLDFGLAKALDAAPGSAPNVSQSPTITTPAQTMQGVILGTAAYMSPEQARGQAVDKRADIWAFGCVLYEMLAGRPVFGGESVSEILAAVLRETPDWEAVPRRVRRLLGACLERDPGRRLRHIGDMSLLLDSSGGDTAGAHVAAGRPWLWPAVAGLILVAVVLWVALRPRNPTGLTEPFVYTIVQPADIEMTDLFGISPDGRYVAVIGATGGARYVFIHELGTSTGFQPVSASRTLDPTDLNGHPIWSPDSQEVAYWRAGELMRADVSGGVQRIARLSEPLISGFWVENVIVLATSDYRGLWRVDTNSGDLTRLTNGPDTHPSPLPGGRFLYISDTYSNGLDGYFYDPAQNGLSGCIDSDELSPRDGGEPPPARVFVGSLDATGCAQRSREIGSDFDAAVYVEGRRPAPDGYLLLTRDGNLSAQRFDPEILERIGEPHAVATNVRSWLPIPAGDSRGFVFPSVGFAASPGLLVVRSAAPMQLRWFDLDGNVLETYDERDQYREVALSRDGGQFAAVRGPLQIWLYPLAGPVSSHPLSNSPNGKISPVFSADGDRVIYGRNENQDWDVYSRRADGTAEAEPLFSTDVYDAPTAVSHDDRYLLFNSGEDIWLGSLAGDRSARLLVPGASQGRFSSDSRTIAYQANRGGQTDIWVQAFDPDPNATRPSIRVSTDGGETPHWSQNEGELFYMRPDNVVMRVEIAVGSDGNPIPGTPEELFEANPAIRTGWNVHPDGDRIIMAVQPEGPPPFIARLNWMADLDGER